VAAPWHIFFPVNNYAGIKLCPPSKHLQNLLDSSNSNVETDFKMGFIVADIDGIECLIPSDVCLPPSDDFTCLMVPNLICCNAASTAMATLSSCSLLHVCC